MNLPPPPKATNACLFYSTPSQSHPSSFCQTTSRIGRFGSVVPLLTLFTPSRTVPLQNKQRGEFLRSLNYSAILFESFPAETILKILHESFSPPLKVILVKRARPEQKTKKINYYSKNLSRRRRRSCPLLARKSISSSAWLNTWAWVLPPPFSSYFLAPSRYYLYLGMMFCCSCRAIQRRL